MDPVAFLRPYLSYSKLITGCYIISIITLLLLIGYLIVPSAHSQPIELISPLVPARLYNGMTHTDFINEHVPTLREGFKPSWWLPNGHAQTIYSAMADFSEDDQLTYQRHLLQLPDGGTLGVDLYPGVDIPLPASAPVIMLNHGLTGGSHESYVRNIARHLAKSWAEGGLGARVAVVNFRGCAGTPLTSAHLYSSGTTLDTHTATIYMSHLFPDAPFFGVGFSLGAAVMTRYLGEQGDKCRLRAAVVLCAPLELREMSARLDARHFFPKLYSYTMARKMLGSLLPHLSLDNPLSSPDSPLHPHLPALLGMTGRYRWTLRASHVTELVAAKVGGSSEHFPFAGLQQFLEWACPSAWLVRIRRPTLAISAMDDPIVSGDCLPVAQIQSSSHFALAAIPKGGHLGWFEGPYTGPDRHQRWHVKPVLEYLRAATALPWQSVEKIQVERQPDGWCWVNKIGWKVVNARSHEL